MATIEKKVEVAATLSFTVPGNCLDLNSFSFTPIKDNDAPFGFRLSEDEYKYSDDQIKAIHIVQRCISESQNDLKRVFLPHNEEFFTCPSFWPLWTWLTLAGRWKKTNGKVLLHHKAWSQAFSLLKDMLKSMTVDHATDINLKRLKWNFLNRKTIKTALAYSPISGLQFDYVVLKLTEEQMMERLKISKMLYIFAGLEADFELFKKIIKAKDEFGRSACQLI